MARDLAKYTEGLNERLRFGRNKNASEPHVLHQLCYSV